MLYHGNPGISVAGGTTVGTGGALGRLGRLNRFDGRHGGYDGGEVGLHRGNGISVVINTIGVGGSGHYVSFLIPWDLKGGRVVWRVGLSSFPVFVRAITLADPRHQCQEPSGRNTTSKHTQATIKTAVTLPSTTFLE